MVDTLQPNDMNAVQDDCIDEYANRDDHTVVSLNHKALADKLHLLHIHNTIQRMNFDSIVDTVLCDTSDHIYVCHKTN